MVGIAHPTSEPDMTADTPDRRRIELYDTTDRVAEANALRLRRVGG